MVQQLVSLSDEKLPAGVSPLQQQFLREAWRTDAYKKVKPKTAGMIDRYYHTDATYEDIAKENHVSIQAVRDRIFSGVGRMRRVMYKNDPALAEKDPYPLEQIRKGKLKAEVFKTEKSKQRRSEASKAGKRKSAQVDVFVAKSDIA